MTELLAFLPFYLVPFAAMFLLRRPHWLAAGAAVGSVSLVVLFSLLGRMHGEAALGPFIACWIATFGFVMGGAARLVLIALGQRGQRRGVAATVTLLFLVGAPLLFSGWSTSRQEASKRRYAGPTPACMASLHNVTLGDRLIRIPLDEGIHVGEGRGFKPVAMFAIREQARVFCERAAQSAFRVTNVQIDFAWRGSWPPHERPPCDRPRPGAWWPFLCRFAQDREVKLYGIALFDTARFHSEQMPSFAPAVAGPAAGPIDSRWRADGPFMRADSRYEVYLSRAGLPGVASPYAAICSRPAHSEDAADGLRCEVGYRLTREIGFTYDFKVAEQDLIAEAQALDERLLPVALSFLADKRALPSGQ